MKDFRLQILDGATGKLKRSAWMPKAPAAADRPYELVSGDSIVFLNLLGNKDRHEILEGSLPEFLGIQQQPGTAVSRYGTDRDKASVFL